MNPTKEELLKNFLKEPNLQNLTAVRMARNALSNERFKDAIHHLRVDADKIRPTHPDFYAFLNDFDANAERLADQLVVGHHYFYKESRRCDAFAHKRYTSPEVEEWETLIVQGAFVEAKGQEIKIRLEGNNGFEKDGETFVFSKAYFLTNPDHTLRCLETNGAPDVKLGTWTKN
jgi:hypothetical protein